MEQRVSQAFEGRSMNVRWLVVALLIVAGVFATSSSARADDSKGRVFKLTVAEEVDDVDGDFDLEESTLREMTRMTAERLEARFEAAGIKHYDVGVVGARRLHVEVFGDYERRFIEAILIPSGHFELRPVEEVGDLWLQKLAGLPEGVQLRQKSGSLTNHDAYLWSRRRADLQRALDEIDMEGLELEVYPDEQFGGWKSVALGPAEATHRDVASASVGHSSTGHPHVRLKFEQRVTAKEEGPQPYARWAAVVDGEIVTMVRRGRSGIGEVMTLPVPSHLSGGEPAKEWSQQVAGRLGAYLPVTLVELDEQG